MVGFVQDLSVNGSMTHHNITCFFAEVDPKFVIEETEGSLQTLNQLNSTIVEKEEPKRSRGKAGNKFLKHKPSDHMDAYISYINDNKDLFSWEANTCML